MSDNIIILKNIKKHYESPDSGSRLNVLNGINLKIKNGESVAVTGPSGSGKSTLLNIIGTLDKPSEGSSSNSSFGLDMRALPIASICCSPPLKLPALCLCLSFSMGK